MARYNNRNIIKSQQKVSLGKLLPGMIVTFNYSEEGVTDPRPILLFLHREKGKNLLEGLNLNYINPSKVKKLFQVIDFKKGETGVENLVALQEDYFRIKIANPKERSAFTAKRFYSSVVSSDKIFLNAYRSYKTTKLSALKVTNIIEDLIHEPGGSPND